MWIAREGNNILWHEGGSLEGRILLAIRALRFPSSTLAILYRGTDLRRVVERRADPQLKDRCDLAEICGTRLAVSGYGGAALLVIEVVKEGFAKPPFEP